MDSFNRMFGALRVYWTSGAITIERTADVEGYLENKFLASKVERVEWV